MSLCTRVSLHRDVFLRERTKTCDYATSVTGVSPFLPPSPVTSPVDVKYCIDANDCISFVDDAWDAVAGRENVPHLARTLVIGRPLWEYVADETTRHLYRQIVARVRAGRSARFEIRCDGPEIRRVLELTIRPKPHLEHHVQFCTRTVRSVERPRVSLLDYALPRSTDVVRACAWCSRIEVQGGDWLEVEEAAHRLRLFEQDELPRLSHGMCSPCATAMYLKLEMLKSD